jgi:hypothetical protein
MNLNGEILSRDRVIATIRGNRITESDEALLPLFLKRTGDLDTWLAGRAIDSHRTNSRILKKALRLGNADDAEVALKVNAVTITDSYWFRELGSDLTYDDVRFKRNMFDKLALRGDPDSFNQPYSPTPELTNIGSFEKCWRLADGQWNLVKQGSALELFSELFVCKLGQTLGFAMAEYYLDGDTIVSRDFTNNASVNFEPADGIVGGDEDYALNFDKFHSISPELAEQYLQIIYTDTLCFNVDRHTKNYGVLRDVGSGEIISMAPNFDNNLALFARGVLKDLTRANDKLIEMFVELLEKDSRALRFANELPSPTQEMIEECVEQLPIGVSVSDVCDFVLNGSELVQAGISELLQKQSMQMGL